MKHVTDLIDNDKYVKSDIDHGTKNRSDFSLIFFDVTKD